MSNTSLVLTVMDVIVISFSCCDWIFNIIILINCVVNGEYFYVTVIILIYLVYYSVYITIFVRNIWPNLAEFSTHPLLEILCFILIVLLFPALLYRVTKKYFDAKYFDKYRLNIEFRSFTFVLNLNDKLHGLFGFFVEGLMITLPMLLLKFILFIQFKGKKQKLIY